MARIKLTVHGIVQGVGFRYHTRRKALEIGLTGYVKNKPDGTVEIVADGNQAQLADLIAWAKQGPPTATVSQVVLEDQLPINYFNSFVVDY